MEKKWYYDAFISYRHTEADSFVAKNLHRRLESFRLPGNVARRLKGNEEGAKTWITRVFRDQEELPLVSNLADPIMEALGQSEFLIVICSPRLKESMWCKKEIETFIGLRGREHVLLVLAEGEPSDSFPEELLYREELETAPDGSIITKKIPAEPLAADVRGSSGKEIKKRISSEVLRLAAPMFGCGYDDLRQRHREQKMRKAIALSLAGSAFCLLFGLISTTMALRINRQNVQITEQSKEIALQSEEIAMQAEEIEKQYAEALRGNCISLAKESANLLEKGDRIAAIKTALQAFPGGSDEDIPYTPQAAYALSESLRLYGNDTRLLPDRMLEADTTVDFMKLSPGGGRIVTVDDSGMLCVWDGKDGRRLASFLLDVTLYWKEDEISFIDEGYFLYPSKTGVSCFDINSGADIYKINCKDVRGICYSEENDNAVISTMSGFLVISAQSGELISTGSLPEAPDAEEPVKLSDGAVMNADGTLFAVAAEAEEGKVIFVYETLTGEVYRRYDVTDGYIKCMRFDNDVLYVTDNDRWEAGSAWTDDSGGSLYACSLAGDNDFLWTYRNDAGWLYEISFSSKEGSSYMLCTSYDRAIVLNKSDGGYIDSFFFGSQIVTVRNYIEQDAFMVFTRDGTWHYANLETMTDIVSIGFMNCNSTNVKMFGIGDGYYVSLPYQDKNVTLYRRAAGSGLELLCETGNRYLEAYLSEDGKYLAACVYTDGFDMYIEMVHTDTGEVAWSYAGDDVYDGMGFYPEKEAFFLITNEGTILFDYKTGERKEFYDTDNILGRYQGTDVSGRYIYYLMWDGLGVYDMADGSLAYEIRQEEIFTDNSAAAVSPSMKYLATASEAVDSLQLYALDELREGETDCLCEIENINATYIEHLFFNDRDEYESGLSLYVVYKNGDIRTYGVDMQRRELFEDVALQDLEDSMMCFIQPKDAGYSIIAGLMDAYIICNGWYGAEAGADMEEKTGIPLPDFNSHGKITAHIDGFLAVDGERGCIYLTDGKRIYRAPIYDAAMLREEAERQLGDAADR